MKSRILQLLGIAPIGCQLPDLSNHIPTAPPVKVGKNTRVIEIDHDRRYFGFAEYERAGGRVKVEVDGLDQWETGVLKQRGLKNTDTAIAVKRCRKAGYSIKETAAELQVSESYVKQFSAALATAEANRLKQVQSGTK